MHRISSMWRALSGTAEAFAVVHLFNSYIGSFALAHGPSMLPTFNSSGEICLAEHLSHRFGRLVPGDVVFVRAPDDPNRIVGKRVLGFEGDKVQFYDPHRILFQNGKTVGDNTNQSHDSRAHGPVPYRLIQGRVFFKVWPLNEFGFVRSQVPEGSGPVPNGK